MTSKLTRTEDAAELRRQAEEMARKEAASISVAMSPEDMRRALHELRVHQIELEMQNEELRSTQAELDASRSRYFSLYDLAPVGYVTLREKGLIQEANLAAAALLGVARSTLLSGPLSRYILKEDLDLYYLCRKQDSDPGRPQACELRMLKSDGTVFWVQLAVTTTPDVEGEPVSYVTLSDITGRKQAEAEKSALEAQLQQVQKLESLGRLAGGVAHDFNNQLGGIMNCADLLLTKTQDEESRLYIDGIIRLCIRSRDLTSKLLAFARQGKYRTVPVNLHETVAEVVSLLGRSVDKRIGITQRLDAMPPTTSGDPTQLQNVLLNLGLNACDAMPEGGELGFSTDAVRLDEEFCGKSRFDLEPGDYLRITVTDTGIGMDEKTLARLFEPFFTTKEPGKGTGLGLASVHGTIVNHRGAIGVDSEAGKGTTVTLHLPLSRQEARGAIEAGNPVAKATASVRILLVDDEEMLREFTARLLRSKGHEVTTANDGVEAVDHYRKSWKHIDIVILDMNMPRMNGRDAFVAMRKTNPQIKAILASGYSLESSVQEMLDAGAFSYIRKPFRHPDLIQQVEQALGGCRLPAAGTCRSATTPGPEW
jgi:PAS domain S-box-containing protein